MMRRSGIERRHTLLAGLLLAIGASARAGAYEEFFHAIEVDDAARMQELLVRGMDPNTRDPQGQHGLYLVLRGGAQKVFEVLLAHPSIEVDARNGHGETPLMMAALRGRVDAMKTLVGKGAQVDREGWTPLHYAASSPSADAVRYLLEHPVSVNARAPNGNTPLMLAARWGHEDSVALLLARGADRSLRNARGLDAVDYARLDGREAVARSLEAHKP